MDIWGSRTISRQSQSRFSRTCVWLGRQEHDSSSAFSYSLTTLTLIKQESYQSHMYASILCNIQELLHISWSVRLEHTLCQGHVRADVLAKLGINRMEELDSRRAADRRCEAHNFCSQLLVELGFCFGVCCFFLCFFSCFLWLSFFLIRFLWLSFIKQKQYRLFIYLFMRLIGMFIQHD